jgi:hypothetical protein
MNLLSALKREVTGPFTRRKLMWQGKKIGGENSKGRKIFLTSSPLYVHIYIFALSLGLNEVL